MGPSSRFILPVLFGVALQLGACDRKPPPPSLHGATLPDPLPKPDFTFTDTAGKPFDFRKETDGYLTLLFFGYTNCPDICPLHMANIGAVVRDLPFSQQSRIKVVFVTVDPERDTPERIREWLDIFSTEFVGLRGPMDDVHAAEKSLMMANSITYPAEDGEGYNVGHASQVVAFSEDGLARVVYPFGTRQEDWKHDLPILLGIAAESPKRASADAAPRQAAESVKPAVRNVLIPVPPPNSAGALYAIIENAGGEDRLVAVRTPLAGTVELHRMEQSADGGMTMRQVDAVEVPAAKTVRLEPGGLHAMLLSLTARPSSGDKVPVEFEFAKAGSVSTEASVVTYAEVERLLGAESKR